MKTKYLITGALGFIGSNVVNYLAEKYSRAQFIILDKLAYCASQENIISRPNIMIVIGTIQNDELVKHLLNTYNITHIINFAAETHVCNSFYDSIKFTENNVAGVHHLLESAQIYQNKTSALKLFIHVSTDEVYGEVDDTTECDERAIFNPTNPYAATKAAAEFIALSYYHSFQLPLIITRSNNVYGPAQYPEKVIPKFICKMLNGEPLTIHGSGAARRTFIHVSDVAAAYDIILQFGKIGEIYNIGTDDEYSVIEIAHMISDNIIYVPDRLFNDRRYNITNSKLHKLGWRTKMPPMPQCLPALIEWYTNNRGRFI